MVQRKEHTGPRVRRGLEFVRNGRKAAEAAPGRARGGR